MKHEKEICRWAKHPTKLKVWNKIYAGSPVKQWVLTSSPTWADEWDYIVDDEYAEIRKAYADGKTIECRVGIYKWQKLTNPYWDFKSEEYRVKPDEPTYYYQWERLDMNNDSVIIVSSIYLTDLEAVNLKYAEQGWRRIDSSKRTWEE